ncbi:MAG: head completion/stabilization protein [Burkholderiales bacterium]|nr:head completion/stabilization protein [Burkholderiales bacterium]
MSFLANESPPPADQEPTIENDGWFPDVDPVEIRAQARLDGTVTPERLKQAILAAMADVNQQLAVHKAQQLQVGHAALAEVPGPDLGGTRIWLIHYRHATLAHVQANLAEQYRSFDTTGAGDKKAEPLEATADHHRRNLHWAIAAITARPRSTVELI